MAIYNSPEMRLLMLRWYDHWLKDNDTGFMDEPPVTIFVRGADDYRREADWPIPRTEYRKLYFHAGPEQRRPSRSTTAGSRGSRRPRPTARSPTRTPTRTGRTSPAAARRPSTTGSCTSRGASPPS